jgi:hypothetical protein
MPRRGKMKKYILGLIVVFNVSVQSRSTNYLELSRKNPDGWFTLNLPSTMAKSNGTPTSMAVRMQLTRLKSTTTIGRFRTRRIGCAGNTLHLCFSTVRQKTRTFVPGERKLMERKPFFSDAR